MTSDKSALFGISDVYVLILPTISKRKRISRLFWRVREQSIPGRFSSPTRPGYEATSSGGHHNKASMQFHILRGVFSSSWSMSLNVCYNLHNKMLVCTTTYALVSSDSSSAYGEALDNLILLCFFFL